MLVEQRIVRIDSIVGMSRTEKTCYRWGNQYGDIRMDQRKDFKRLQKKNEWPRCAVSYRTREILTL